MPAFDPMTAHCVVWLAGCREQYDPTAAARATKDDTLPTRFADVTTRRHTPKKEHPIFLTSNATYGSKAATQIDMPDMYAGASGTFTNSFAGGQTRTSGLVTAITTSKVHRLLDDF